MNESMSIENRIERQGTPDQAHSVKLNRSLPLHRVRASVEAARAALQQAVSDVTYMDHIYNEDPSAANSAFFGGKRWLNMAREDLQTGLMKLERAIELPNKW